VRATFFTLVQTGPGAHPASCTMGNESFPGVKSGRGVTLTLHPLLVPWSRKSRAIPLPPLWAVRPVQSLSACTGVHLTLCNVKYDITNGSYLFNRVSGRQFYIPDGRSVYSCSILCFLKKSGIFILFVGVGTFKYCSIIPIKTTVLRSSNYSFVVLINTAIRQQ
jgi:hypothetical protein